MIVDESFDVNESEHPYLRCYENLYGRKIDHNKRIKTESNINEVSMGKSSDEIPTRKLSKSEFLNELKNLDSDRIFGNKVDDILVDVICRLVENKAVEKTLEPMYQEEINDLLKILISNMDEYTFDTIINQY